MRVLVTGANGFIGAALCQKLVEKGHGVRGLTRETSDLSLLEGVKFEHVIGSLDDRTSLESAVDGTELVFHAASMVSDWGKLETFRRVNVDGTVVSRQTHSLP